MACTIQTKIPAGKERGLQMLISCIDMALCCICWYNHLLCPTGCQQLWCLLSVHGKQGNLMVEERNLGKGEVLIRKQDVSCITAYQLIFSKVTRNIMQKANPLKRDFHLGKPRKRIDKYRQ